MPTVRKLNSTDGFVVTDYDATPATGVIRVARKILESSATDLCRSATYTFATFGIERSGASAGINAEGDDVAGGLAAAVDELAPDAADNSLRLLPAKGVPTDFDLTALRGDATEAELDDALAASVLASLEWALGGSLSGRTVAVEESATAPIPRLTVDTVRAAGATIVDVPQAAEKPWMIWGAEADAIIAGSKPGTLTHQGAPMLKASVVVPWGPIPATTRALAMMQRSGITYVPDFVSTAGPLLASVDAGLRSPSAVSGAVVDALDQARSQAGDDGLFLAAANRAEAFLRTWQEQVPFGRPLAA